MTGFLQPGFCHLRSDRRMVFEPESGLPYPEHASSHSTVARCSFCRWTAIASAGWLASPSVGRSKASTASYPLRGCRELQLIVREQDRKAVSTTHPLAADGA